MSAPVVSAADLAEAAMAYAARGWPVFPLRPRAKVPLIPKEKGGDGSMTRPPIPTRSRLVGSPPGQHRARRRSRVLGPRRRLWRREAAEQDGADTIAALQQRFGRLPETVTSLTGGGGWQYLFVADGRLNNGVRALPGIDTRSHGGYIVAVAVDPPIRPRLPMAPRSWPGRDRDRHRARHG